MLSLNNVFKAISIHERLFAKLSTDFSRSCVTVNRKIGTSNESKTETNTQETPLNKNFINRNPRNLEKMGIAWKRKGWRFQHPSREFHHRVVLEVTNRKTEAYLEHCSGAKVITCSSNEKALRKYLYSATDISTASNIGMVMGQRCMQAGVTEVLLLQWENPEESQKFQSFKQALTEAGLSLQEVDQIEAPYTPGIDYEDPVKLEELRLRQYKVWCLGKKNIVYKHLNKKIGLKGRARPILAPKNMTMPAYQYQG